MAILLFLPLGAIANRYTDPRTGQLMPPQTLAGVVEWMGALAPALWAGLLLYRAFTPRGFDVRCSACGSSETPPISPSLRSTAVGAAEAAVNTSLSLGEANQFLRYRAVSKAKVDAQAALMDALLARPDVPPMTATLLRSRDPADEFPWLIVKSGTHAAIASMREYAGFKATFAGLFGGQPFSIAWADHIAENCPGPGETVTPLGRERYAAIAGDIRDGKYVVERRLGPGAPRAAG